MPDENKSNLQTLLESPSYRLAEEDVNFIKQEELRHIRLMLELLKPEMGFVEQNITSTIVVFGGTKIVEQDEAQRRYEIAKARAIKNPHNARHQRKLQRAERNLAKCHYYEAAREFAAMVSSAGQSDEPREYVVVTGGGPGIMEAANRGAYEVGAKSIGLNITMPEEQTPNSYITPELCFRFHYFALRKMHFLLRAKALVIFPGGFGTLDELFDALTLRQTGVMQEIPMVLYGRKYWEQVLDLQFLADEGVIRDEHLDLVQYAESPQEAWDIITRFHQYD